MSGAVPAAIRRDLGERVFELRLPRRNLLDEASSGASIVPRERGVILSPARHRPGAPPSGHRPPRVLIARDTPGPQGALGTSSPIAQLVRALH